MLSLITFLFSMILKSAFFVRIGAENVEILEISRESCRFELHTSKLSWDKAHQACKQRGLTLASLSKGAELQSMATVVKQADEMYSKKYNLESSKYWVGLRMEVNPSGKQEFHWGDCSIDSGITKKFDKLRDYPSSTGCGYVSKDSLSLTSCPADKTMAFICEHPSGSDSCFTTMSAISKMGFDSKSTLTSSGCASSCLSDSSCAGIYVSKETMCTLLTYKSQMSWTLAASDLQSTHMFHRRLLYHSSYNSFQGGLTEDELCQIPVASPIVTTEIPGKVTTKEITPSPTLTSPDTKIDLNSVDAKSTSSMLNSENQLHSSSIPNPCISQTSIDNSNCQLTQNYTTTSEGSSSVTSQLTSKYSTSTEDISLLTSQLTTNHQTTTQDSPITSQNTALLTEDIFEVTPLHNSTVCTCTCRKTNESLQEKLQKISKLKVKTYTLSSVIRTKVSADDTRLSARCFGAMGIAILSFFGGAVVCSDVIPFFKFLVRKK